MSLFKINPHIYEPGGQTGQRELIEDISVSILHKLHQSYEKHNPASEDSQYKSGSYFEARTLMTLKIHVITFIITGFYCWHDGDAGFHLDSESSVFRRRKSPRWLQAPKLTNKQMEKKDERL